MCWSGGQGQRADEVLNHQRVVFCARKEQKAPEAYDNIERMINWIATHDKVATGGSCYGDGPMPRLAFGGCPLAVVNVRWKPMSSYKVPHNSVNSKFESQPTS